MPLAEFPIEHLFAKTKAYLAEHGVTTPHGFGEKFKREHKEPPAYVWFPTRSLENKPMHQVRVDQPRTVRAVGEYFEVHCWGVSFAQAYALRNNLVTVFDALARVDIRVENAQWIDPSRAWTQMGEVFVLECSLSVPIPRVIVNPNTLEYPEESTFVPRRIIGRVETSASIVEDGEFGVETTTTPSD